MSEEMTQSELQELLKNVDRAYSEPIDAFKFLAKGRVEEFFKMVIDGAIEEYEEKGGCPIIEMQKYKGFVVDYYFLTRTFCRYVENFGKMREVSRRAAERIKKDFVEGDEHVRNGKMFVSVLENLGYVVSNSNRRYLYTKQCLVNKDNGSSFIVSAVVINSGIFEDKFVEQAKKIRVIAGKEKIEFKGVGPKFVNSFFEENFKKRQFIIRWE